MLTKRSTFINKHFIYVALGCSFLLVTLSLFVLDKKLGFHATTPQHFLHTLQRSKHHAPLVQPVGRTSVNNVDSARAEASGALRSNDPSALRANDPGALRANNPGALRANDPGALLANDAGSRSLEQLRREELQIWDREETKANDQQPPHGIVKFSPFNPRTHQTDATLDAPPPKLRAGPTEAEVPHPNTAGVAASTLPQTTALVHENDPSFDDTSIPCADQRYQPNEKIDIVVTWVNYTNGYYEDRERPFDYGTPLTNQYANVGLKRPMFTEICETIRSFLYNDRHTNLIGNIFVVYNGLRHDGPLCFKGFKRVIPTPQATFLKGTVLDQPNMSSPRQDAVWSFIHRIPGLRRFFVLSHDDIFLLKPFSPDVFASNDGLLTTHLTGGNYPGTAGTKAALKKHFGKNAPATVGLHVPFIMQKCASREVEEVFGPTLHVCSKPTHLCQFPLHYPNMVSNYMIMIGSAKNKLHANAFSEIHTTPSMKLFNKMQSMAAAWVDVQGEGVSDEYKTNKELRKQYDEWLRLQPWRAGGTRLLGEAEILSLP